MAVLSLTHQYIGDYLALCNLIDIGGKQKLSSRLFAKQNWAMLRNERSTLEILLTN